MARTTWEAHVRLSDKLVEFTRNAEVIVSAHYGALIYSGGDDVLAFLPLDQALACADALRREFEEQLTSFPGLNGKKATLSCGISFAHYSEHLQNLLEWGRQAERAAKHEAARNSLAVHLHTRTGGEAFLKSVHSWGDEPVTARWNTWITLHRQGKLPCGMMYELRTLSREVARLQDGLEKEGESAQHIPSLLRQETERILKRKRTEKGMVALKDDDDTMRRLLEAVGDSPKSLGKFVDELLIAKRVADTQEIAEGGPS